MSNTTFAGVLTSCGSGWISCGKDYEPRHQLELRCRLDKGRFTKEQPHTAERFELRAKTGIGEHGEVGRDQIEIGAGLEVLAEEIGDATTSVVIANAEEPYER